MLDSYGSDIIGPQHLKRTAEWVRELRPDADEALLIAALCHDIERAKSHAEGEPNTRLDNITGDDYLTYHQERSARIMREFLVQVGADPDFTDRVAYLIAKHEVGGDDDQDLLKDADSISFLENNIDLFLEHVVHMIGHDEMLRKFQWMYDRITSKEAEAVARPLFLDAMERAQQAI